MKKMPVVVLCQKQRLKVLELPVLNKYQSSVQTASWRPNNAQLDKSHHSPQCQSSFCGTRPKKKHVKWIHHTRLMASCDTMFTAKTFTHSYFSVVKWAGVVLMMLRKNFLRFSARCIISPVVSKSLACCGPSEESSSFGFWFRIDFSASVVASRNHWAM